MSTAGQKYMAELSTRSIDAATAPPRANPSDFTFSTAADMIDEAAATTNGFNLKEIAAWLRSQRSK